MPLIYNAWQHFATERRDVGSAPERILVVAFKYPPYAAVGGKRWAKLSKYLARQGTTVHVLTVPWKSAGPEALLDVSDPNIRIHRVPSMTPNRIRVDEPTSLLDRARNRIYRDRVSGRAWAQDADLWGPVAVPAAAWLARRHRVDAVIVTGSPFMAGYWIARAQRFLPDTPLIQEFRDPWADLPDASLALQGGRARVERLERRLIDSADAIVTVTHGLSELIRAKSGDTPVHTITNGYDPEELPPASPSRPRPFRLIHGGNLFAGREEPLQAFLDAVVELRNEMPELELIFRGRFPEELEPHYRQLTESGVLQILPPIPGPAFMKEVDDSFATLQFNARQFPYALSTKIFEYGASGRTVLSVNYGGEVHSMIEKHHLGWTANAQNPDHIKDTLRMARARWLEDPSFSMSPKDFDASAYGAIAEQYSELIGALIRGH